MSTIQEHDKYTDVEISECVRSCEECTGSYLWPRLGLRLICKCIKCGHQRNYDQKGVKGAKIGTLGRTNTGTYTPTSEGMHNGREHQAR